LAAFELQGIQRALKHVPRIRIVFMLDENGILSVKATDQHTGCLELAHGLERVWVREHGCGGLGWLCSEDPDAGCTTCMCLVGPLVAQHGLCSYTTDG
jgi:hypothetical protein